MSFGILRSFLNTAASNTKPNELRRFLNTVSSNSKSIGLRRFLNTAASDSKSNRNGQPEAGAQSIDLGQAGKKRCGGNAIGRELAEAAFLMGVSYYAVNLAVGSLFNSWAELLREEAIENTRRNILRYWSIHTRALKVNQQREEEENKALKLRLEELNKNLKGEGRDWRNVRCLS